MKRPLTLRPLSLVALLLLGACGSGSSHLQYDVGRAYLQATRTQADLGRPSVAEMGFSMSGTEALELRKRVVEETTDVEAGTPDAVKTISVE